jgi:hypothetical protein
MAFCEWWRSGFQAVHSFDTVRGERKHYPFTVGADTATGLALAEDGARLFLATKYTLQVLDLRTGTFTVLAARQSALYSDGMGCVMDKATRSLLVCDHGGHRVVRIRGVDM